jgi:hypothetical protein
MIYQGISILADENLFQKEIELLVDHEISEWEKQGKKIAKIELLIDGDEVIIKADEKSNIRRVRRITGYLSNIENFNDAKRAECLDRVVHGI